MTGEDHLSSYAFTICLRNIERIHSMISKKSLEKSLFILSALIYSINATTVSDNFNDGNAIGWLANRGTWSISNGKYVIPSGSQGGKTMLNWFSFSDFTYEADVTVGGSSDAGLTFRVTNPSVGSGGISFNGYYLGLYAAYDNVTLGWMDAADWHPLVGASAVIDAGISYRVKVVASGQNLKVYIDGVLKINTNDTHYSKGQIGLRSWNASGEFDNIHISDDALLQSDDFNDGDASGWQAYSGQWSVTGKRYTIPANSSGGRSFISSSSFADFTLEADILVGNSSDAGLPFRVVDPGNFYGYYVGLYPANDVVTLGWTDWAWHPMASASVALDPNVVYHLKVTCMGQRIIISLDNKPIIEVRDSRYSTGRAGVRSWQAYAQFDNVKIYPRDAVASWTFGKVCGDILAGWNFLSARVGQYTCGTDLGVEFLTDCYSNPPNCPKPCSYNFMKHQLSGIEQAASTIANYLVITKGRQEQYSFTQLELIFNTANGKASSYIFSFGTAGSYLGVEYSPFTGSSTIPLSPFRANGDVLREIRINEDYDNSNNPCFYDKVGESIHHFYGIYLTK